MINMIRKFVDRKEELDFLEERYENLEKQLIILYGRRRIGKTELIKKFISDKPSIYFLADQRGTTSNASRFTQKIVQYFGENLELKVNNFDDAFRYLNDRLESGEKPVIAIDEFSYLVKENNSIPSVFQLVWDEILEKEVFLILCGSLVSMMREKTLSRKSPLYGRRTGQWKLKPLKFKHLSYFFPNYDIREKITTFSILGGIPAYLVQFDPKKKVTENIRNEILQKGRFLFEEVDLLLREELRQPGRYKSILEAMAKGNTRITDIANEAGLKAKDLPRYLGILRDLDLVEKHYPVTKSHPKRGIYKIKDNYFKFWFRFIFPRKGELEIGNHERVLATITEGQNRYISSIFEEICKQVVEEEHFPVKCSKIGKWWYREEEIDLVGLDEGKKEILFGECKWSRQPIGVHVLKDLEEKARKVQWKRDRREEWYALFSKSGFRPELKKLNRRDLLLFDLERMEKIFRQGLSNPPNQFC